MKTNFVDCFMLIGTALSMSKNDLKLPEMSRPLLQEVFTTPVNISLSVQEIRFTDLQNMIIEMHAILSQRWVDPRLGANIQTRKLAVDGQIWKPKIISINSNNICNINDDAVFWRGFGDEGNILLSEKLNLQTKCTENFKNFPFDTQSCKFIFGSYRFTEEEVELFWGTSPIPNNTNNLNIQQFILINITALIETDIRTSGNFSVAVINFTFKRQFIHYLICISLPCTLLTLLTYITLFLDFKLKNLRLTINLIIFGVFLFFYYLSVCCLTQPVPYLKAIDIYVIISMTFSLVALLETFTINNLLNQIDKIEDIEMKNINSINEYLEWIIYWLEMGMKIFYPTLYIFAIIIFSFIFV